MTLNNVHPDKLAVSMMKLLYLKFIYLEYRLSSRSESERHQRYTNMKPRHAHSGALSDGGTPLHGSQSNFLVSSYPPSRLDVTFDYQDGGTRSSGRRTYRRESFGSGKSSPTSSLESARSNSSSSIASSLLTLTSVDRR